MSQPLADRIRPHTLDEVVGQKHLLGKGKPLRRIIESGHIPNLIFYGPTGVGKTTVARMIAEASGMRMHKLNGTNASLSDIKEVVAEIDTLAGVGGILLYLDEIQYLNKKQQQSLLEYIEQGDITLIASTTENPYFSIYNAILSRSTVFEFKQVEPEEVERALQRAFRILEENDDKTYQIEEGVLTQIATLCGGDVRKAVNTAELCALSAEPLANPKEASITVELARSLSQRSSMRYDRDGEEHYDLLSALQKSIRGSSSDAAIYYLARLLSAGDLLSPCRRLLVIAAEDIGLAYPQAVAIVKACVDSAIQLGLPEAQLPLAEAAILLATAPKSNSSAKAIWSAMEDVGKGLMGSIPRNLQNKHYDGSDVKKKGQFYLYPHDYPGHYVKQQYLPDALVDRVYYEYGENKTEQLAKNYWKNVKEKEEKD